MYYSYSSYNPIYGELLKIEKKYLMRIIGKDVISIEHFGSTAVPKLGGKEVIDIYVLVPKAKLQITSNLLQSKGYIFKDYAGDKDRLFHNINKEYKGKSYHYHIHLSYPGTQNFKECMAFRDYLIANPKAAKEYAELKKTIADKVKNLKNIKEIKQTYIKLKDPFIEKLMKEIKKM